MTNTRDTHEPYNAVHPGTYNGWPNRETWATSLHLDNDEGTYLYVRDLAETAETAGELAELIKGFVTDELERVCHEPKEASRWGRMALSDIGSYWRVDWHEIAENIWDEVDR